MQPLEGRAWPPAQHNVGIIFHFTDFIICGIQFPWWRVSLNVVHAREGASSPWIQPIGQSLETAELDSGIDRSPQTVILGGVGAPLSNGC